MNLSLSKQLFLIVCLLLMATFVLAAEKEKSDLGKRNAVAAEQQDKPATQVAPKTTPPPAVTPAVAPEAGEQINWQVISSGGTEAMSTTYGLSGTVGQTATGAGSSASYGLLHGFWQDFGGGCCVGRVGDANNNGGAEPTIGDITAMIDAKFITGSCEGVIECIAEADINLSGTLVSPPLDCDDITIGDITKLIDYLFITGKDNWNEGYGLGNLPPCP